MDKVIAIGIDLAKNIVSVHGVDSQGKGVLRKSLKPAAMFELLAVMEPCKVGMQACSGAHDTARRLRAMGHDARIIAPKYVAKFRQKQKNDANDAECQYRVNFPQKCRSKIPHLGFWSRFLA